MYIIILDVKGDIVEETNGTLRQPTLKKRVARFGGTNHIRCEECGDDRDGDDDRIEKVGNDAK